MENQNNIEKKIKFIDLFAGCGGLFDGFMQSGMYKSVASVEWEKAPVNTLKKRLKEKSLSLLRKKELIENALKNKELRLVRYFQNV